MVVGFLVLLEVIFFQWQAQKAFYLFIFPGFALLSGFEGLFF